MTALHPLPASVVARCAATDGLYGSAHGVSASGLRLPEPNEDTEPGPIDQVTESLADLADDMRVSYARWLADQEGMG